MTTPVPPAAPTAGNGAPILITGATGDIGGLLVDELAAREVPIRVMCRRSEQVRAFTDRGIAAVLGDFDDAESLRRAMDGCGQVFLLAPGGPDQFRQDREAIDAAKAAGVSHVVKVSTLDANPDSAIPWARDHARADEYLTGSGLAWTRLQPGAFTKNLLVEAAAVRHGWLPQTGGHGATAWVDVIDIAAVAARVLTDRSVQGGRHADGRAYLLTGDRPLSYPEVAVILSASLGRRVRYLHVPAPLFYGVLRASRVPAWQARGLIRQFVDVVRRGQDDGRVTTDDIPDLLGRPARGIADFARAHRAELGGR